MTRASRVRAALAVVLALVAAVRLIASFATAQVNAARRRARQARSSSRFAACTFRAPCRCQAVSVDEARTMLERESARAVRASSELARLSRVYVALGLLPAGTDLEHAFLELYSAPSRGILRSDRPPHGARERGRDGTRSADAHRRRRAAARSRRRARPRARAHARAAGPALSGSTSVAHDVGEDDAQLARHAVYEGDATLAGFAVVLGKLKPSSAVSLAAQARGRSRPDRARLSRDPRRHPRDRRSSSTSRASTSSRGRTERAGWEGVNALLARPPRSTEQILHPEKYFVRPEYPLSREARRARRRTCKAGGRPPRRRRSASSRFRSSATSSFRASARRRWRPAGTATACWRSAGATTSPSSG